MFFVSFEMILMIKWPVIVKFLYDLVRQPIHSEDGMAPLKGVVSPSICCKWLILMKDGVMLLHLTDTLIGCVHESESMSA